MPTENVDQVQCVIKKDKLECKLLFEGTIKDTIRDLDGLLGTVPSLSFMDKDGMSIVYPETNPCRVKEAEDGAKFLSCGWQDALAEETDLEDEGEEAAFIDLGSSKSTLTQIAIPKEFSPAETPLT